jgi:hypothetical protein
MTETPRRTYVYIDGFNFYYRALRRTPYKWLDMVRLADHILGPRHNVAMVRYFTAHVIGSGPNDRAPQRQQVYLAALGADPRLTVHLGQFRPRTKTGPIKLPPALAGTFATIATFEEKGSDVNMASWALADAYEGRADTVVLLTNDSDLAEPAHILQNRKTPVGVIVPASGLKANTVPSDFTKTVRTQDLAKCQLPATIRTADGQTLHKPARW